MLRMVLQRMRRSNKRPRRMRPKRKKPKRKRPKKKLQLKKTQNQSMMMMETKLKRKNQLLLSSKKTRVSDTLPTRTT